MAIRDNASRLRFRESFDPLPESAPRTAAAGPYAFAFVSGVLGAIAMSALMVVMRVSDIRVVSFELLLGTLITGRVDSATWVLGFIWHLINGGIFALFYAAIFAWMKRSGPILGMEIGVVQWVIGGVWIGIFSALNPFIPGLMPPPGFYGANDGTASAVTVFLAHLLYGAIVGGLYRSGAKYHVVRTEEAERTFQAIRDESRTGKAA